MTSFTDLGDARPSILAGEPTGTSRARANVLLVDDQPAKLLTYEAILSGLGVRCVRASSGKQALELLLLEEFAVLILDVHMPGMDGFELAGLVREHPRFERVPIIFVTGVHVSELDHLRGYQAGAIDYIPVPVVPEILRSKVAVLVELYLKRRELQRLNQELKETRCRLEAEHVLALTAKDARLAAVIGHPDQFFIVLRAVKAPSGVIRDWLYINVNDAALSLFGVAREELIGKCLGELFPDRLQGVAPLCLKALESHEPVRYETSFKARDIMVTLYAAGSDTVVASSVDVTARKQAEQQLQESEQRFRNMADHAPVMIWVTDTSGDCIYLNRLWCEFTGQTPQVTSGLGWLDAVHHDDRGRVHEEFARANAAQIAFRLEYRLRNRSGRYHWVIDAAAPRIGVGGVFTGYVGSVIDITERKSIEEALRQGEQRFRELADAMPQIVFSAGADGVTEYFNRKWYELTETSRGATDEESWIATLHPDDRQRCLDTWYGCVRSGTPYQIEYRFNLPGKGGYRWHLGRALPVRDDGGEIVRWYGTCTDIHDLRLAQEALRSADRRKDEFLATLAHELRNPLAPIRSAVEYLRLKLPQDPKLDSARSIIERQTKVMVRLVDDLLDLSRITRGHISLRKELVSVDVPLQSAMDACRPLIEALGHELVLRPLLEPVVIEGDVTRISQVLVNVLNNAAKYTPARGRIEVTVEREDTMVSISISDNGTGIPSDMLESIFEMFVQIESTIHRSHGGLGIGLTLARQLVEMHQGRITARSAGVGAGSEFKIYLPITAPTPVQSTVEDVPTRMVETKRRILIADDNVDAAQTLRMLIELLGHEVRTAHDGLEAMKCFSTYQPDIVLLDIGMPRLSGYEVATRMRAMPGGGRVALVAISGWGQESDRRTSREAGFDHHLTKPIELQQLRSVLEGPAHGATSQ